MGRGEGNYFFQDVAQASNTFSNMLLRAEQEDAPSRKDYIKYSQSGDDPFLKK